MDNHVKHWILPAQVLIIYTFHEIRPVLSSCDPENTNSTDCRPRPNVDIPTDDSSIKTYNSDYLFLIVFGVAWLPFVILIRLCWVRAHVARQNRRLIQARNQLQLNSQENYLPSYERSIFDLPPSYDQLEQSPSFNKLRKNKSSSSLPSYSEEDKYPVYCMTSLPEDHNSQDQTNNT